MDWKEELHRSLVKANDEARGFSDIITAYEVLVLKYNKAYRRKEELERDQLLSRGNEDSKSLITIKRLEEKVSQLQEEVTSKYKSAASSSDITLKLSLDLQATRNELSVCQTDRDELRLRLMSAEEKVKTLSEAHASVVSDNNILRQEILKMRALLEHESAKTTKLTTENNELVTRLVQEKTKMAEQLNAMNSAAANTPRKMSGALGFASNMIGAVSDIVKHAQETVTADVSHLTVSKVGKAVGKMTGTVLPTSLRHSFQAHTSEIHALQYVADGSIIASTGDEGYIKLWSTSDGSAKATFRGSDIHGPLLFLDSKGKVMVGGGTDKNTRVWSLESERIAYNLSGHRDKVYCGRLSHDTNSLVTGGADRTVRLWDLRSGYNVKTISCKSACFGVDVATDGCTVVSGHRDMAVRLWDLRTGNLLHEQSSIHTGTVTSTTFSVVGSPIALSFSKDNTLAVLDATSFRQICSLSHPELTSSSNSGNATFAPNASYCGAGSSRGSVFIFDLLSKSLAKILTDDKGHKCAVGNVQWNPDGWQVASSSEDGLLCLWE